MKIRYFRHLVKLRFFVKNRKIKVGFWMTQYQKWSSFDSLYHSFENDEKFEPFVLLSYFKNIEDENLVHKEFQENISFLEHNKIKYYTLFDEDKKEYFPINKYKADIIFYQQPWQIPHNQTLFEASKNTLPAYVPYCYYSLNSYLNYMSGFHKLLWKYFVESDFHLKEYEKNNKAKNCICCGSTKLDNYITDKRIEIDANKLKNKKRIIYAPHHSFTDDLHDMGTFIQNGKFILELAQVYKDNIEWVFRPHPAFNKKILENKILSEDMLQEYYDEWKKLGFVSVDGEYYELFRTSDGMITDSISFLAEYLPTKNPVLHLRKDNSKDEFNNLLQTIIENYYQIYDNRMLQQTFEKVIINDNDYKKNARIECIKYIIPNENKTAADCIREYLRKELWIK